MVGGKVTTVEQVGHVGIKEFVFPSRGGLALK